MAKRTKARLQAGTGQNPDSTAFVPYRRLVPSEVRRRNKGRLTRQPSMVPDYYQEDVSDVIRLAGCGDLSGAAMLMRAAHSDGVYAGVLESFTSGITRLPVRFTSSDPKVEAALKVGHSTDEPGSSRSLFDDAAPTSELAALLRDGRELGVYVAELVWLEDLPYPLLIRLDPEFLRFDRFNNCWTYVTVEGQVVITPGDGYWLLGCPGGRAEPWLGGIFPAIGRSWAQKFEANLSLDAWTRKFAGAARVGFTPPGATRSDADDMLDDLIAYSGMNSSFTLPQGFDIKLLESGGIGFEVFSKTIARCDESMILTVAGQITTTQGAPGFDNGRVAQEVHADVKTRYARSLDNDLNDQFMPYLVGAVFGAGASATRETVTAPPKDKNIEAQSLIGAANAVTQLTTALELARQAGITPVEAIDLREILRRFDVPLLPPPPKGTPTLKLLPGGADKSTSQDAGKQTSQEADKSTLPEADAEKVADSALNGAQVSSLVAIVQAVVAGTLPRDAAIAIIKRAFNVDDSEAESMLGSAGTTFKPTAEVAV